MVAEPVISSIRVLCGAPRTLIEHSMRKHMPSSVEELDRICGEFVGAGPFSFDTNFSLCHQAQTPGTEIVTQAGRVSAGWSQ